MRISRLAIPMALVMVTGLFGTGMPAGAAGGAIGCGLPGGPGCDTMTAHNLAFQDTDTQDSADGKYSLASGTSNYELKNWSLTPQVGDPNCAGHVCPAAALTARVLVLRVQAAGPGVPFGTNLFFNGDSTQPKQGTGFKDWQALNFFQNPNRQGTWHETSTGGAANGDFLPGMPVDDGFAWGLYYSWNPTSSGVPHGSWGFTYFTPEFFYLQLPCNVGDALDGSKEGADTGTLLGWDVATGIGCGSSSYDGHTLTVTVPYNFTDVVNGTNETFTLGAPGEALNDSGTQIWGERSVTATLSGCLLGNTCLPNVTGSPVPTFLTVLSQSPNYNDQGFDKAMEYGVYRRVGGGYPNPSVADCRAYIENMYSASNWGEQGRLGLPPTDQSGNGCYIKNNFGRRYHFALSTSF